MTMSKSQKSRLETIIKQAEMLLKEANTSDRSSADERKATSSKSKVKKVARTNGARRSRSDAAAFRKEILSARKKGLPVSELAEKYGVTNSYIYQIR